jgi:hypothetical protein
MDIMTQKERQLKSLVTRNQLVKLWPDDKFNYNKVLDMIISYLFESLIKANDDMPIKSICLELGLINKQTLRLTAMGQRVLYYGMSK